jgi:hypothetical protein
MYSFTLWSFNKQTRRECDHPTKKLHNNKALFHPVLNLQLGKIRLEAQVLLKHWSTIPGNIALLKINAWHRPSCI